MFTQLQNFKDAKYDNTQVKLILQAIELKEILTMGLSMPSIEFVTTTLAGFCVRLHICDHSNYKPPCELVISRDIDN